MLTVLTNSSVKAWIICSKHYYNAVLIFPHKHSSLMKNRLALFSEEDKVYLKLFVLLQRRGTSDYLKVIRASVLRQLAFWTRHRKLTPETLCILVFVSVTQSPAMFLYFINVGNLLHLILICVHLSVYVYSNRVHISHEYNWTSSTSISSSLRGN